MPRISILMPTHDRPDTLGLAIASVLAQTERDFELLIVGDGVADTTRAVVAGFSDPRIRWFDLPKGPSFGYANRNVALRQATGDLIGFAADDDLLFSDHIRQLSTALEARGLDWIYSRPLWVSTDGVIVPFATNLELADERAVFMSTHNTIPASCVVLSRDALERAGYWPEHVPSAADWRLWQQVIHDGSRIGYHRVPTTLHFSAKWKQSRHSSSQHVLHLLQIADAEPWWPAALKVDTAGFPTEQAAVDAALATGGAEAEIRHAIDAVIDRLAWELTAGGLARLRPKTAKKRKPIAVRLKREVERFVQRRQGGPRA